MNIAVFGLGYVGSVQAACHAASGHSVIGVDPVVEKVELINRGQSPVLENGLEELITDNVSKGMLRATIQPAEAVRKSSVAFICVGTPSRMNGSPNFDNLYLVAEQIGNSLKGRSDFYSIVICSTVLPGTVSRIAEIVEQFAEVPLNEGFGIAASPEFLREGSAIYDFNNPPYILVGTSSKKTFQILREVYSDVEAPFIETSIEVAEMTKYANNSFHALKVAYANEIGVICKEMGINGEEVMDILCRDTKLNISSAYLKPGFAFGGSCLPKDVRALSWKSTDLGLQTILIENILTSNELHIERVVKKIESVPGKRVALLGLSFKPNTDDLRESPFLKLSEKLINKGFKLRIYDEGIDPFKLHGANSAYIQKYLPNFRELLYNNITDTLEGAELVILGNNYPKIISHLNEIPESVHILDLNSENKALNQRTNYEGICW